MSDRVVDEKRDTHTLDQRFYCKLWWYVFRICVVHAMQCTPPPCTRTMARTENVNLRPEPFLLTIRLKQ